MKTHQMILIFLPLLLTAKFLHITDIHLDPYYTVGTTLQSSCHHFESLKYGKSSLAGLYGSPASGCDAPRILVDKTFEFLNQTVDELDFIIWTGDNARHDSDPLIPRDWNEIKSLNSELTQIFKKIFHGKKVLPSIGNNDIHPHNTLAYDPQGDNMILNTFARLWQDWIPKDQIQSFRIHGCFTIDLKDKIRGISLNTIYLFNSNAYADDCHHESSPGYVVLTWLENVLKKAEAQGVNVYISGHVPPNPGNFVDSCYVKFTTISQKYKHVIQGQFYGHMNLDHFMFPVGESLYPSKPKMLIPSWISVYFQSLLNHYKRFTKKKNDCLTPILVAPSVVPAFNPAFRVFDYEQDGSLLGYQQYFSNLSFWNSIDSDKTNSSFYTILYEPKTSYGLSSLNGCEYKDFARRLVKSTKYDVLVDATQDFRNDKKIRNGELLKSYLSNMMVGMPYDV